MQRLGKNHGAYFGETIEIATVLRDIESAAREHGWKGEQFGLADGFALQAIMRTGSATGTRIRRVYLSTGIHGDEPAGPLAALQLLRKNKWPETLDIWFCPCLNPAGFRLNRRENADGADLNRQYQNPTAREIIAHIEWLKRQPGFDLCLCLHEDWESHGFYIYELNPENQPSLAEAVVESVEKVCPIDRSEVIEGRPARGGIIRPSADPRSRPDWPEAFYLLTHKTRLSYTLEAPSDFPLQIRVAGLVAGVNAALEGFVAQQT